MSSQRALVQELIEAGVLPDDWRDAGSAVDRAWFIPDDIWIDDAEGEPIPVSRNDDLVAWEDAVYQNIPILTQFDDGNTIWPSVNGIHCTSSASQPNLVFEMLDALAVERGNSVLEIGTGTGYNAALLAAKVGDNGHVTSVEVDAEVAQLARGRLAQHDIPVQVRILDAQKSPLGVDKVDRLIATVAAQARQVPRQWLDSLAVNGIAIIPLRDDYAVGCQLMRFTKTSKDKVVGESVGEVAFMPLRGQRTDFLDIAKLQRNWLENPTEARMTTTTLGPWLPVQTWDVRWAIGARIASIRWEYQRAHSPDQPSRLWLADPTGPSWAWASSEVTDDGCWLVAQYGPRSLWTEVESAYRDWLAEGSPTARTWRY